MPEQNNVRHGWRVRFKGTGNIDSIFFASFRFGFTFAFLAFVFLGGSEMDRVRAGQPIFHFGTVVSGVGCVFGFLGRGAAGFRFGGCRANV